MAFGSRNKGRAQEARPRPRCSRAKKELRLRRRVPWLDLLCRSFFESISLGQILSLKRCSNQVELALPIDKKMIRSPNDSRDYRSSVSRTIPRRGFVQWAGYFRPIYFFRSKYPLASGINNDLSGAARAPPFSLRPSFLAFSIFMLSRVSRFLSFFFFKRGGDRSEKSWLFIPVSFHAPFISIHCSPFFLFLFLRVRTPLHALRRLTNATAWAISEVASCFFRDRIINITILFPFYAVNELRYVFCKYTQLFQTTTNN